MKTQIQEDCVFAQTSMKRTFNFGKIRFTGKCNRVNLVTVDVELRQCGGKDSFTVDRKTGEKTITGKTPEYMELSIRGSIWNASCTDIVCGGQCLDTIAQYRDQLNDPNTFAILYDLWKRYHLNGMHAGTPEQEAAVKEWRKENGYKNSSDWYTGACEMLKEKGLYEVLYTGLPPAGGTKMNRINMGMDGWLKSFPPVLLHR